MTLGNGIVRVDDEALIAESLQLPNVTIEEQLIKGALITYKFASGVKWEDATITFYDTEKLLGQLESWRDIVYTNAEGIKSHVDYKRDSSFELLDGKGQELVELKLKNSWPKSIAHGPLSYGSSDIKIITLTLSYDFAEFN